jgi:translocation and assembly module TamB
MRYRLLWISLALVLLTVVAIAGFFSWLVATESGLQWAYNKARGYVPGELSVTSLRGKLRGPLEVRDLRFSNASSELRVDYAQLNVSLTALFAGRLDIQSLNIDGARVTLQEQKATRTETQPFSLPMPIRLRDVRITDMEIRRVDGTPWRIASIDLAADAGSKILDINRLAIVSDRFELHANGSLGMTPEQAGRLSVSWSVALPQIGRVAGHGDISGYLAELTLSQQLTAPTSAVITARIADTLSDPKWQVTVTAPELHWQTLQPTGPAARFSIKASADGDNTRFRLDGAVRAFFPKFPELAADIQARGGTDGEITIDRLTVRRPGQEGQIVARGNYKTQTQAWAAHLEWQRVQWPLAGNAVVVSPAGQADVSGAGAQYRVALSGSTVAPGYPNAMWQANASGNARMITLDRIRVDTLGGSVDGTARVAWSPTLEWEVHANATSLNPADLLPAWPGQLSFAGDFIGTNRTLTADIRNVRGQLRDQPIAGHAHITKRGHHYPQLTLALRSGASTARVNGSITEQWNLAWNVDINTLSGFVPDAQGSLEVHGRIRGDRPDPYATLQLSGTRLGYAALRVDALTLDAALNPSQKSRSRIALRATDGLWNGRAIDEATVVVEGTLQDHVMSTAIRAAGASFDAVAQGQQTKGTWQGVVQQSAFQIANQKWTLIDQPQLTIAKEQLRTDRLCWRNAAAQFCAEAQREKTEAAVEFSVDQVPLALLTPLMANPVDLEGTITGHGNARFGARGLAAIRAELTASAGAVTLLRAGAVRLTYESGSARLVVDNTGMRADARLHMTGNDRIVASVALPNFQRPTDNQPQPIEGKITLELQNLAPLAVLLPVSEPTGSLSGEFQVSGTIDAPQIAGRASLERGAAHIGALGIQLQNARLLAVATGENEIRLTGYAESGGGEIGVSGRLLFPGDRAWRADVRLAGASFQVVDLGATQVFVSPDLRARLAPGEIRITGDVLIPRATFAPRTQQDVVQPSPDVVFVNAPQTQEQTTPSRVSAEVRVTLGRDVRFVGFGLNAGVSGSLTVIDAPNQVTTARGELRVAEGIYEAFGQKLQLERGRLIFVGGPANNPGIDARAVRRVDDVTAGVEVQGTLQSPKLALFSEPEMGQADTLSYLLFGHAVENPNAQQGQALAAAASALRLSGGERVAKWIGSRIGIEEVDITTGAINDQASLVLGKRLSPRLYVNYSIGLFERANVFRIQYRLSRYWMLEAQSGTNSAGGDLLYTIEN